MNLALPEEQAPLLHSTYRNEYHRQHFSHDIRVDGRRFDEFQQVTCTPSEARADHHATHSLNPHILRWGKGGLFMGSIRAEVAVPSSDRPNAGHLEWNVQLPRYMMAGSMPRQAEDRALELNKHLQKLLPTSMTDKDDSFLALHQLVIAEGQAIWVLYVDIVCLNDEGLGSLVDPILYLVAKLFRQLHLPQVLFDADEGSVTLTGHMMAQPLLVQPRLAITAKCHRSEEEALGQQRDLSSNGPQFVTLIDPSSEERTLPGSDLVFIFKVSDCTVCDMELQTDAASFSLTELLVAQELCTTAFLELSKQLN